jgi:hypothetical protein
MQYIADNQRNIKGLKTMNQNKQAQDIANHLEQLKNAGLSKEFSLSLTTASNIFKCLSHNLEHDLGADSLFNNLILQLVRDEAVRT